MRRLFSILLPIVLVPACIPWGLSDDFGTPCETDRDCSVDFECNSRENFCVPTLGAPTDDAGNATTNADGGTTN